MFLCCVNIFGSWTFFSLERFCPVHRGSGSSVFGLLFGRLKVQIPSLPSCHCGALEHGPSPSTAQLYKWVMCKSHWIRVPNDINVPLALALQPQSPRVYSRFLATVRFSPVSYLLVDALVTPNKSLGVNKWSTGVPSRMYSHVTASVPGIDSETLTKIKSLLYTNGRK